MERTTSLGHRITQEKKTEFNLAFNSMQAELLKQGISITKEDFLEAIITVASNSKKQIALILADLERSVKS